MFPINIQDTVLHFTVCLKYVIDPRPADVGQPEWFKPLNTVMCHDAHFIIKIPPFLVISSPSTNLYFVSSFCNRPVDPASLFSLIFQLLQKSVKQNALHSSFLCEHDTEPQESHQKNERRQMKYLTFLMKILAYFCGEPAPVALEITAVL